MIENVNLAAPRFVNQRVGILARVYLRDRAERLEINHARLRLFAVRGKSTLQLRDSHESMNARHVRDLAGYHVLREIDDDDFRRVRQIKPARC